MRPIYTSKRIFSFQKNVLGEKAQEGCQREDLYVLEVETTTTKTSGKDI